MAGWELSPSILGSIGEGSGGSMTDLVKIQSDAQQKDLDRQSNEAKATVSSLINSYNSAKSVALQGEIVNTMKSYASALPPHLRQQVEPYIRNGPTSEISEKTRQFLLHNKAPKPPIYNEAPGAENANKYLQANHMFEVSDFKRKLNGFVYGASTAGDKQNFMGLDDGSAAIRGADGQVMIMSQQDLGLKELEKKTGIPIKDMLMNPNGVPTGKKGFMTIGGRRIETEETYKPFEADPHKRQGTRITNVADMPKSDWEIDHPPTLRKMLLAWKNPSTDDETVEDWKERTLKGPKEATVVAEEMSVVWPQYSFRVVDIKKESWWKKVANILPFVSAHDKSAVIPIRGRPIGIADASGKLLTYYYDAQLDLVSNGFGEPLGSYEQVTQMLSAATAPTGGK
jgi:hypothetical protein